MKSSGGCFFRVSIEKVWSRVGHDALQAGICTWSCVRVSHMVLFSVAWKLQDRMGYREPLRLGTLSDQERPLMKMQPLLQWIPRYMGDVRTMQWPPRTVTGVEQSSETSCVCCNDWVWEVELPQPLEPRRQWVQAVRHCAVSMVRLGLVWSD